MRKIKDDEARNKKKNAMSNMMTNPMNSFMAGPPNFGYPDGLSSFGLSSGLAPAVGAAAAPFYVPPVDPSILTQFMLSPDFSSVNSAQESSVATPALEASAQPVVKLEQGQNDSQQSAVPPALKSEHDQTDSQMS